MDPELEKYRELFTLDAGEQLESIRKLVPEWEADPGNAELVKKLHRGFHSLKGLSATMGFSDIFALAQKMVVFYDKLRVGLGNKIEVGEILKTLNLDGDKGAAEGLANPVSRLANLSRQSIEELDHLVRKHSRPGN